MNLEKTDTRLQINIKIDINGKTSTHLVLLISSEMPEIIAVSDHVFTPNDGNISCELVGSEITEGNLALAI